VIAFEKMERDDGDGEEEGGEERKMDRDVIFLVVCLRHTFHYLRGGSVYVYECRGVHERRRGLRRQSPPPEHSS
jgi:hypothetical protein